MLDRAFSLACLLLFFPALGRAQIAVSEEPNAASVTPDDAPHTTTVRRVRPACSRFDDARVISDEDTRGTYFGGRAQLFDAVDLGRGRENTFGLGTARLWAGARMDTRRMRFDQDGVRFELFGFVQAGLAPDDFENGVPLYDAFMRVGPSFLDEPRCLEIKFGQFFVPFGRMRNLAENQYQVVRRAPAIDELAPARDIGVALDYREGHYLVQFSLFGGEGRNRFATERSGVLSSARFVYEPLGIVDTRNETAAPDQHREPVMSFGASFAYNRRSSRSQGSDAQTFTLGTADELHVGFDALVRYRGFSAATEVLYRRSRLGQRSGVDADDNPITEYGRHGVGYVVQASFRRPLEYSIFELWLRWSHLVAYRQTDPALEAIVHARGKELAYGVDLYLTDDHHLKLQIQLAHQLVPNGEDTDQMIVALDGTFDLASPARDDYD